jgi:iron(III) transport system substrate-binding protein
MRRVFSRVRRIWVLGLACHGLCLQAGIASALQLKEAAESETKMVWYTTISTDDAKMLIDQFRQRYPKIDAEFFRTGGPRLMERIFTEARAGKHIWDVFMNSAIYTQLLAEKGMLAVYESSEARYYREGYKDPRRRWTSIYTNYAVAGYNTKFVPKEEVPKSYSDLLKRFWSGQIGLDAKSYEWFAVVIRGLGEEQGLTFMRRLAKTNVQLRDGRELVAQLVAAGEFKLALTAYSQNYETLKLRGAPVDWVALDPVYANIHPVGLSSKAPHPKAGKLFIDFLLSKTGQEILRSQRRIPDRIDTPPDPPRLIEGIKPVFGSPEMYSAYNRYIKLFRETFASN